MTGSEICTRIVTTVKERIHSEEFREKYRIGDCFTRIRQLTMGIVMMFLPNLLEILRSEDDE